MFHTESLTTQSLATVPRRLLWNYHEIPFCKIVAKRNLKAKLEKPLCVRNMVSATAGLSHHRFGCSSLTTVAESKRHLPGEPSVLFPHGNLGRSEDWLVHGDHYNGLLQYLHNCVV